MIFLEPKKKKFKLVGFLNLVSTINMLPASFIIPIQKHSGKEAKSRLGPEVIVSIDLRRGSKKFYTKVKGVRVPIDAWVPETEGVRYRIPLGWEGIFGV